MKDGKGGIKMILIIAGILVFLAVFIGSIAYGYVSGLRTEGIRHENGLSVQYLDNQNLLSEFISGFYEQAGIADLKSEKMDKIITDAVTGRYGDQGFSSNGALFSAIREAYPDIEGLNIYDKIIDYIRAKREEYKAIQTKLLDMLRTYDNWRESGFVNDLVIGLLGVPTQRLAARVGNRTYNGVEAREKMYQIVLTDQAVDAYQTGRMAPLTVPK